MSALPLHFMLGQGDDDSVTALRAALQAHPALRGHALRWHLALVPALTPWAARDAAQAARADGGVVVAVGGDGTINAASHACCLEGVPLGVLPQGTFNYFGRQHQLGESLAASIELLGAALRSGERRAIQVGEVNGQTFVVNASLGLYPRLLADREAASRELGRHRSVALAAGFVSLLRPFPARRWRLVEGDTARGQQRERVALSTTLFVGLNGLQLARVGVPEVGELARGRLVVTTLAPLTPWAMLSMLWAAWRQRIGTHPAVDSFACDSLTVDAVGRRMRRSVSVAFDGERARMTLPLRFSLKPRPLMLVAPALEVPTGGARPRGAEAASTAKPALAKGLA